MMKITAAARTAISSVRIPLAGVRGRAAAVWDGAAWSRWLRGAAACWPGRVALLVRSWRYFVQKRDWLAQAVAGSLAGRPRCR